MIEDPGALSQRAGPPSQGGGGGFDVEEIDEIEEDAIEEEVVGLVEQGEEGIESLSSTTVNNNEMKFIPVVQVHEICEEVGESGFGCVQGERVRV